jgi:GABA(A) receptor-associated protein
MLPSNSIKIKKYKYLISNDLNISQFFYTLRKHIIISEKESIFLLFGDNNIIEPAFKNIKEVYDNHKSKDGFLYCRVVKENVFG